MRFLVEIEKCEPGYVTVSVQYRGICIAERVPVREREKAAADMIKRLYGEVSAEYERRRTAEDEREDRRHPEENGG